MLIKELLTEPCAMHNPLHDHSITFDRVQLKYNDRLAIKDISGQFASGSMQAIIGPNGGGKTTLLKLISGLMRPTSGSINLGTLHKSELAYLAQSTTIDRSFPINVQDVVTMGLYAQIGFYKRLPKDAQAMALAALKSVGLHDCANRTLDSLSGGQFQRVLFARTALQNAKVILLDEPFAAVDAPTMEILIKLLQQWHQQGKTIICILHDIDLVREFFPTTLVLARKMIAWGKTEDVVTQEVLHEARQMAYTWEA